jgi:hypothetical protein
MHKIEWVLGAIAISLGTLLVARQFVVCLPADHFCTEHRRPVPRVRQIAQRVGGVLLIALGAVLALPGVPGQGLLLVLIGLMLLDLPPLRRLELRLLRLPLVNHAVNGLRGKAGKPPLQLPDDQPG